MVLKRFGSCEHEMLVLYGVDIESQRCRAVCDLEHACCSRRCKRHCDECKSINGKTQNQDQGAPIIRRSHVKHDCDRLLFCGHSCKGSCEAGHECSSCEQVRVRTCIHAQKSQTKCSEPMKPCKSYTSKQSGMRG
jgi:hypothetical protein